VPARRQMHYERSRIVLRLACAGTLCMLLWGAEPADPARDLITKSVDSERENRRRMVNYLFVEEISRRAFDRDHNPISTMQTAYEVLFIEGRPAFRRTSINGRALTPEEDRAESARLRQIAEDRKRNPQAPSAAEERRRSHPFHLFLDLHDFQLASENEVEDGRRCWVIDSKPKRKLKASAKKDDKRIAESTARFWIDKETLHRVRMDVTALKPKGQANIRESTSYRWAPRDGSVWLITSIQTVLPTSGKDNQIAWYEGEQRYSRYRRFTTESSLINVEELSQTRP